MIVHVKHKVQTDEYDLKMGTRHVPSVPVCLQSYLYIIFIHLSLSLPLLDK